MSNATTKLVPSEIAVKTENRALTTRAAATAVGASHADALKTPGVPDSSPAFGSPFVEGQLTMLNTSVRRFFRERFAPYRQEGIDWDRWPSASVDQFFGQIFAPGGAGQKVSPRFSAGQRETMKEVFGSFVWD